MLEFPSVFHTFHVPVNFVQIVRRVLDEKDRPFRVPFDTSVMQVMHPLQHSSKHILILDSRSVERVCRDGVRGNDPEKEIP